MDSYNQMVSFIWGIANDCLVDTYDVGDYRKVILPMTVIRRFDAVLEGTKEAVIAERDRLKADKWKDMDNRLCIVAGEAFCNFSDYTLKQLTAITSRAELKKAFIAYLDGFSKNVQDIIDKFGFRGQIDKLSNSNTLGILIQKFIDPRINISNRPVLNSDGSIKQPPLDNHTMGMVFEEVIRRFNEETNVTDAGRHFTPRDIVQLMADLAFIPVQDIIKAKNDTYTIYDGACGTGGMLTVGEERILEIAKAGGKKASIHIFGQENAEETYAIARSDMLLKGAADQAAEQADNIKFGSTISNDKFRGRSFNFMLSNPPFGTSWKKELDSDEWGGIKKDEISDTRFVINYDGGEFRMVPDVGDPQMLFLANNVSKMKKANGHISRIVEVHNAAAMSTGKAGQGSTNLRRYIIERDMLEAIVALPESMFYNTGIGTFLWILTSKKSAERKGTVQIINATTFKRNLRKNIGNKSCEISEDLHRRILDLYLAYDKADPEYSVVLNNDELGYWSVPILRPQYGEDGKPLMDKQGRIVPDKSLTDVEKIPFTYDGGIQGYFDAIVKPYVPDAKIDEAGIKIGYEISFVKYFYQPEELRETSEVLADIEATKEKAIELLGDIISQATTARATADVKMKDVGSKWIGQIPAHWDWVFLSQICKEQNVKNKGLIEKNVLSLSHGNIIRKKDLNYGLVPKDYDGYQIVEDGNIILRLTDLQNDQKSLRTALVRERGIITSAYTCLKTTQHPRYVQLILHVYDLKKYFYGLGGGVRQSIGFQEIRNLLVPIPPMDEQIAIAAFVDRKAAAVAAAVAKLKDEIKLLGQYKNQMAADIITGKMPLLDSAIPDFEPTVDESMNDFEEVTESEPEEVEGDE